MHHDFTQDAFKICILTASLQAILTTFCVSAQYGMTPLMHAAYKGKADMCKLLLQHGADVNSNEHEHGYTALMFAGLSGRFHNHCGSFFSE